MKVVCLIPIKLNNVRLPNKNIKLLNDNPLCSYLFNTIIDINLIDEIYCYCSDEKIKNYLPEKINFLLRDKQLDKDSTSMTEILHYFVNKIDADIYVLTHVTSPFLHKESINICINNVLSNVYDSAFTGTYVKDFLWDNKKPLNYNLNNIPRTQDIKNVIKETSGLYVFRKDVFTNNKQRIGFNPYIHIINDRESLDIDTILDFKLAEFILKDEKKMSKKNIKLVVFDFDGVFTNGKIYFNNNSKNVMKCYNGKDSFGLNLLNKKNIKSGIITADTVDILDNLYHIKDRITKYSYGNSDKLSILNSWLLELDIKLENVAYIGDDLNDIPVINKVGFSACPSDAIENVKLVCDYICINKGGAGCVREFIDKILQEYYYENENENRKETAIKIYNKNENENALKIYNKTSCDKWRNKILDIYNNDELIIVYEWFYDTNSNNWNIVVDKSFEKFCNDNKIKICETFNEIQNNINIVKYNAFLFTKSDSYMVNNKILASCNYNQNKHLVKQFDPELINKKIYSKACNINNKNFLSFPVGIYNRNNLNMEQIKTSRIRTPESIKSLLLNNYLNCYKNIKNYIYFLQTARLNKDSININPLYVKICDKCENSNIVNHTTNQENHWTNLNNHLFCLCVSWNTLESPRLWESLYFGCIPIIIDYYETNDFVEKHYNDLPILYIKDIENLFSEKYIKDKYISIMSNIDNYNFDKITMKYWKNILKT
jgi:YrbI family 3-deoxy-D-manno-octulosonate 8-phosphate phosphatase